MNGAITTSLTRPDCRRKKNHEFKLRTDYGYGFETGDGQWGIHGSDQKRPDVRKKNASLRVVPIDYRGNLLLEEFKSLINGKTRLIALMHVSNVLGCVNPVKKIIDIAREENIPVLVDAAQSVKHMPVDVKDLGCDFLAFSGHKVYAAAGIGVLFGRKELLEEMPPCQYGSAMIDRVNFENTTFAGPPLKYEAGTVNYP